MKRCDLERKHPEYRPDRWDELTALAKGGERFHKLIDRFLPPNPLEHPARYEARKRHARYYSYTGAIINLYTGWLFANGFEAKACEKGSTEPVTQLDPFYGEFQENVAGDRTLRMFMTDRFREAMTTGRSVWLAELPAFPEETTFANRQEYDQAGAGRVWLTPRDPRDLLDWEENVDGTLKWAVLKTTYHERGRPGEEVSDKITEEWRVYDAETVTTYRVSYQQGHEPAKDAAVEGETTRHGFQRVPVMRLCLPEELCIGEQTYDAQVAHFCHDAALSWSIYMTCYAMPVFNLADPEARQIMGAGYGIFLGPEEKVSWLSPPTDSYEAIARNRDSKRDEIFRIVHQMAQGLDNNAETVGRSAESKEIDAAATRIMLNAYGELVGECIESMYELISEARDEKDLVWSVEGFSAYDVATAATLLANVKAARSLGIPSETLHKELTKKAAKVLTTELDENVKATIRKEIDGYKFTVTDRMGEAPPTTSPKEDL